MKRVNLFEFHEFDWFPAVWRNLFTDTLSYFIANKKLYSPVGLLLKPLIEKSDRFRIIDLCSGAGSPVATVINSFDNSISDKVQVVLTDKFPNVSAFTRVAKESNRQITFTNKSIDATKVPQDLSGFRTFFSSFHHFDEKKAQAILSDAVGKNEGIGIFEFTGRSLLLRLIPFLVPLQLWLLLKTPFRRPFSWQRILWTYLIPVVPFLFFWDGIVSCLRSYSETELWKLVKKLDVHNYSWKIGQINSTKPFRITYLIGIPMHSRQNSGD